MRERTASSDTTTTADSTRWPHNFSWRGYWGVLRRAAQRVGKDRVSLVSAGIAFFALLALFPALSALVAAAGLVLDPQTVTSELQTFAVAIPEAARSIILGQVREVTESSSNGLSLTLLISILFAIYSASRGVSNLIAGLNVVYAEEEKRGFIRLTLFTLALTAVLVVIVACAIAVVAVLPAALRLLGENDQIAIWSAILRWPILLLIGIGTFSLIYRYAPSRRAAKWRWLAPGSVMACILWVAVSIGFSWYVENFGGYNETFGVLGGVIVLLLWLWISTFIVLLGALINAELEAQTAHDSTIGSDRPMGDRGAVKADTAQGDT